MSGTTYLIPAIVQLMTLNLQGHLQRQDWKPLNLQRGKYGELILPADGI